MSVIRDTAFAKSLLGTPLSNNIFSAESKIKINDTQKKMGDIFVHYGKIEKSLK